ncbi:MAG: bifunctional alpha,alpha-trehalose-phosphate synthase (UDP-forming)/trehalose-phosphatase [Coriobacteriia bacterium]|nr:bifunctional alpha,alpha-trehalose-phosphate synthase (UDP-forming)/trehalose-phosphatase [Coriobacteriia bacterium]
MSRLLIVSNRLPVNVDKRRGQLHFRRTVGGLATAVASYHDGGDSLWIGWAEVPAGRLDAAEKEHIRDRLLDEHHAQPVFLTADDIQHYYHGFSNKALWPLFHHFTQYAQFDPGFWATYERVNRKFRDAVLEVAEPGDTIWVHDYQLMLLPGMLRDRLPEASIGFFLHIPFPVFEIFRMLPWRAELLEGVLGSDLVGFHTYDYVRYFLASCRRILGAEDQFGRIAFRDRIVNADAFPIGIDFTRYAKAPLESRVRREAERVSRQTGQRKLVLSVDRLDYTKGIPDRLRAFDSLLERHPEWRNKVNLVCVAVPSRTRVEHYRALKRQVDELVGYINGRWATMDWTPVRYLYRSLPFHSLVGLYAAADVAMVTPLRDGMNLVAKEYVAASAEDGLGVLVLSEMAGAAKELGEALIINPNDRDATVEALNAALTMPEDEQRARNEAMHRRLRRYDVQRWAEDFLQSLRVTKRLQDEYDEKLLSAERRQALTDSYARAPKRLLVLDYDGTLMGIAARPENVRPDPELLQLLERLADDKKNDVAIVSGRERSTLEEWLGQLPVRLAAEHGAWLRSREGEWVTSGPLTNAWKERVRPLLEMFTDRTPGSFIEEKDFSLVWHFRKAHPDMAGTRVSELKETLVGMTGEMGLGLLEGKKVLEVKNQGVNKGQAAHRWMERAEPQFILAMGDDRTDEDLFEAAPEWAWTIRVGRGPSRAAYSLSSVDDARMLLWELAAEGDREPAEGLVRS